MSRTTIIAIRYSSLAMVIGMSAVYLSAVLPIDENMMDLKTCIIFFLGTYFLMTAGLLVFNRLRKFDIALMCWAALSIIVVSQFGLYKIGLTAQPHTAELAAGVMGILASLLPVCVANIRGEARQDRHNIKQMAVRRMVGPTSQLMGH